MAKNFFTFGRENYLIILAGVVLVIVGFYLMSGGAAEKPSQFDGNELFSAKRITAAPILVILGYVVVIFGIMRKTPNEDAGTSSKNSSDVIDR